MGQMGRGTGEHLGIHDDVDLIMATFSKSLASMGGVIAGRADVINWIKHKARSLLFQASMTPPAAAAALKALEIIQSEPERRARLWDISERAHRELRLLGFDTRPSVTPVIPIVVGDQALNFIYWRKLTDAGIFVSPVTRPAVERDLVRAVFMATHTDEQVDRALEMFKRCGREVGIIPYEKPHTRVEVKMARPGSVGFISSRDEPAAASPSPQGSLDVGAVLSNRTEPLGQRLSDAAELLTWRAVNLRPEDVRRLVELPDKLWTQRHRVQNRLMWLAMDWVSRRQTRRRSNGVTNDEEGDQSPTEGHG